MKKYFAFTLVEVLITVAVIAIAILALYGILTFGITMNLRTKYKTIAYHCASSEMEILRDTPFASLTIRTNGSCIGTISDLNKLPSGSCRLTIQNYTFDKPDLKQATINISWKQGTENKQVQMSTLITKGGLNP